MPLFKDTYGHQSCYITSMKSSQISLWKPKSLHVQKYLSNKIVKTNLLIFIRNAFFFLASFEFCGVSQCSCIKRVVSVSKRDLGGPSVGDIASDLLWTQVYIWCTDLTPSQTNNKDGPETHWWTKLNTAGQMEINYKLCIRLWKSTPALIL